MFDAVIYCSVAFAYTRHDERCVVSTTHQLGSSIFRVFCSSKGHWKQKKSVQQGASVTGADRVLKFIGLLVLPARVIDFLLGNCYN